jgi:hypothetical protein
VGRGGELFMTDVTIRGIDDEVYARFTAEAKKRSMPIGELTTLIMRALVDETTTRTFRIGDLGDLTVLKKDLDSLDGMVTFFNIKVLEFDDQIDWEIFDKKVGAIVNVGTVKIPSKITRFQALTKCRSVGKVN